MAQMPHPGRLLVRDPKPIEIRFRGPVRQRHSACPVPYRHPLGMLTAA